MICAVLIEAVKRSLNSHAGLVHETTQSAYPVPPTPTLHIALLGLWAVLYDSRGRLEFRGSCGLGRSQPPTSRPLIDGCAPRSLTHNSVLYLSISQAGVQALSTACIYISIYICTHVYIYICIYIYCELSGGSRLWTT